MRDFDDDSIEPFRAEGVMVPLIRLTLSGEPPAAQITVGDKGYVYDRSYPIKGHSAVMPQYLKEQMSAGKSPIVIERPDRFYVYFAS